MIVSVSFLYVEAIMKRRCKILFFLAIVNFGVAGCYVACPQVPSANRKSHKDAPFYKEALLAVEQLSCVYHIVSYLSPIPTPL